jgi:hypothetical protein
MTAAYDVRLQDRIARTGRALMVERAYRCRKHPPRSSKLRGTSSEDAAAGATLPKGALPVGDARYGRRDNGLVAAEYAAVGDVDPRVGEHLLDLLAMQGIAAYLRPSSDLHPVTRSTMLPKRPTDRLFVDRARVATARAYLARLARDEHDAETAGRTPSGAGPGQNPGDPGRSPEPSAEDVDRAFAEIVAGLGHPPALPAPDEARKPRKPSNQEEPVEEGSLLDGLDTFGADLPDDEPGEFVPPEPPPVPRPSLPTALGVVGVVGGLAVFLKPDLLSFLAESLAMFLGFAAVVTGFATLVWRLRPGGDDDEPDPDQGARV